MKYSVTSVEASKMLKKLMEEKRILSENENMSAWFNAALGEDVESVRPEYDAHGLTQHSAKTLSQLDLNMTMRRFRTRLKTLIRRSES